MEVLVATALLVALLAPSARAADTGTGGNPGVTLLHLGVVGTVQETPDLLAADLVGSVSASDPATAQRQLDNRMKAATKASGDSKGVDWQVADYAVDQSAPDKAGHITWTAGQTLHLRCADADTLLTLVGKLQGTGLAVGSLQWVLSPARLATAQQHATEQALRLLRTRADAAAATLGLHVAGIRSVMLEEAGRPRPMPMMMRKMAVAAAEPQASRTDTDVSQSAEAEIALTP